MNMTFILLATSKYKRENGQENIIINFVSISKFYNFLCINWKL